MIVAVPQIDADHLADEGILVADQGIDRLALRPDGAAQLQQLALGVVDLGQLLGLGATQRRRLETLEMLAQLLDDRIVAVDHCVDERIGQVIGPGAPDGADAHPDAAAYRFEDVAGPLLQGQHPALTQEDAQLFHLDL